MRRTARAVLRLPSEVTSRGIACDLRRSIGAQAPAVAANAGGQQLDPQLDRIEAERKVNSCRSSKQPETLHA